MPDDAKSELLDQSRVHSPSSRKSLKLRFASLVERFKVKQVLSHVGLLFGLCGYCFAGGLVNFWRFKINGFFFEFQTDVTNNCFNRAQCSLFLGDNVCVVAKPREKKIFCEVITQNSLSNAH